MITSKEVSKRFWNQGLQGVSKDFFESVVALVKQYFPVTTKEEAGETVDFRWFERKYFVLGEILGIYTRYEDSGVREKWELGIGAVRAVEAIEKLPELRELVKTTMDLWDSEIGSDAYLDHRPWYKKVTKYAMRVEEWLGGTTFESYLVRKELEKLGFRRVWSKRFKYGNWLIVRERLDGTVIVRDLPGWAVGYLIGKGGQRARELGIRVKIIEFFGKLVTSSPD
jgi:hypothetical protein